MNHVEHVSFFLLHHLGCSSKACHASHRLCCVLITNDLNCTVTVVLFINWVKTFSFFLSVEKAALVFSLKLDNGHKLLCPWMDNACDEMLAQFPPATVQDLVDGYEERSSALLQLVALPLISSAAINYMRSSQLEHFLRQSPVLEHGNVSTDTCQTEYLGNECDAVSANLYFQVPTCLLSGPWILNCF